MKELTTEQKAQVLIETGVFSEDLVTCGKDFIEGAYAAHEFSQTLKSNRDNEALKELILGMANDAGRHFVYHDRKECEQLSSSQFVDALRVGIVTKEEVKEAFWKGVKFED